MYMNVNVNRRVYESIYILYTNINLIYMIFSMNKKKISKNNIYINSLTICFIILSLILSANVYATHISEPILSLEKDAKYNMNETISVNGWIKYNEKPASDVLVLLKLLSPNGNEIFQDKVRSDSNGNFTSNVTLLGSVKLSSKSYS